MASPQKENGYTKIANEILEKLYETRIDREPMRIILFILRKTYGYNKKRDRIALSQFESALEKKRAHICRDLNTLINMKIIIKIQDDNGSTYEFNKDYDKWELVPPTGRPTGGNELVPPVVITPVPPRGHTKETITKETIQKKEELLTQKTESFLNEIQEFLKDKNLNPLQESEIKKFASYWTEPNKSRTKIKWELEKTWDMPRRIARWMNNNNFEVKNKVVKV